MKKGLQYLQTFFQYPDLTHTSAIIAKPSLHDEYVSFLCSLFYFENAMIDIISEIIKIIFRETVEEAINKLWLNQIYHFLIRGRFHDIFIHRIDDMNGLFYFRCIIHNQIFPASFIQFFKYKSNR